MVSRQPATGLLLVAAPALREPTFAGAVLLLLDVDENGALAVVLNRPMPVVVGEVLTEDPGRVAAPQVLFEGGPVSPEAVIGVARRSEAAEGEGADRDRPRFQALRTDDPLLGVVDLDAPTASLRHDVECLRVFVGYAGWGPGQLRRELAEGSWHVVPALACDPFTDDPGGLWREVLRRQPDELALLSTWPEDVAQN